MNIFFKIAYMYAKLSDEVTQQEPGNEILTQDIPTGFNSLFVGRLNSKSGCAGSNPNEAMHSGPPHTQKSKMSTFEISVFFHSFLLEIG